MGRGVKIWVAAGVFLASMGTTLYYISTFRVTKNFHVVDPGKFYRSAQLSGPELERLVDELGIKTVISLRGKPDNLSWMKQQEEVLKRKQVRFQWFWWTSNYLPDRLEFIAYLDAVRSAEYPILIHCRSGADRTGEAAAIYAIDQMGVPKQRAIDEQLSWNFWHIDWLRPAKKELVKMYQGYQWARSEYDPCKPELRKFSEPGHCP